MAEHGGKNKLIGLTQLAEFVLYFLDSNKLSAQLVTCEIELNS